MDNDVNGVSNCADQGDLHTPAAMATNFSDAPKIALTSIRLVRFCKEDPSIWFIQMEAQFASARITRDAVKYQHMVSSLDPDFLLEIKDLIKRPPQSVKYKALKARIMSEFQVINGERLKELLNRTGNQRPSRSLRCLRDLTEGNMSDNILKAL